QGFRLLRNLATAAAVDSSPTLSTDVQLIAFTRAQAGLSHVLIYSRADCGFLARPALDTGHEKDPAFTQDFLSLHLAFARDTLAHWRIRLMYSDGSMAAIGHLGDAQPYDDWQPAPNVDGSRIAFVSNRVSITSPAGDPHVYVYDVAHDSLIATPGLDAVGLDA